MTASPPASSASSSAASAPDSSPAALARIAARVAVETGALIAELRGRGVAIAASKSSSVDIVTEADRAAERLIVSELRAARPEDGVLGEEGTGIDGRSPVTWVVDPIDGTVNYLYGIPAYAVSIAATVRDETAYADGRRPIAGAVYNPCTGELFDAWAGGGARLNGDPIAVTGLSDLSSALVGTGFGYTAERRAEQAQMVSRLLPLARDIRRMGSAALDLCSLAAGRLDAYYELGLQPWDYAAGVLIAEEAGAAIIGRDDATRPGTPFLFAGAPTLVEQLRTVVLGA
ncbi:inositol monophosphatase family protein [Leucobacter triazinivorans]|uniref:Inositol-1-monophosphatase n=1 Tax=Leucobacter triazinivorans TaxID=1784719 RepID=A0A4P6KD22_9MICO|nr:inositol monophosphatase family protein [Leucobacter triazinivorans]QBE47930.1 inositol monophosphatase [Leucobacter triazinivorans]